jgi:hypothetical protein
MAAKISDGSFPIGNRASNYSLIYLERFYDTLPAIPRKDILITFGT